MTKQSFEIASLLCSRLCHDMMSPVGALSNGIELLGGERDPEMRQRCMELLEQSAKICADKLKFFRLAFGAAGGFGERVPVSEPCSLIEALAANTGRVTVNWTIGIDTLPKAAVKVMLNLAHIGLEALVRGGTLEIGVEQRENASEIVVRAAGPRIAFDEDVGRALEGSLGETELSSRTAPAALIRTIASECGGGLQFARSDDALILGAVLPDR